MFPAVQVYSPACVACTESMLSKLIFFDVLETVIPSNGLMTRELCLQVMLRGKSPLDTAQEIVAKSPASTGLSVNSKGEISGATVQKKI